MGPCPWTKFQVAIVVTLQLLVAAAASFMSWPFLVVAAYVIGGTANSNLQLAMHEISHNLAFSPASASGRAANRALSVFANLPLGIPAAISFRKYHLDHHRYQGDDVTDVDIPCEWEGRFFQTPLRKILWIFLQPAFYGLRPLLTNPKPLIVWEAANIVAQLLFDGMVLYLFGIKSLAYLLLGSILGMGLHPTAYHFLSEHSTFVAGAETYSYYGPLNALMYNVGHHVEHHDFPSIPGSRLHRVREIAPEFYAHLPFHTSWLAVFRDFILRDDISPFSRVKRNCRSEQEAVAVAPIAASSPSPGHHAS